jgi:hypothetical protein
MDVIAQAQSGTGKTATFSISILQQIDTNLRECQVSVQIYTRISWYRTKQCCGSGMFIPDPNLFHTGAEFFPSRIRIK